MVQDSNASCLDVALDVLLAYADGYAKASELSTELAPAVVAKGLSGRPGTITRAEAALLKLMEVKTSTCTYIHSFQPISTPGLWSITSVSPAGLLQGFFGCLDSQHVLVVVPSHAGCILGKVLRFHGFSWTTCSHIDHVQQ